MHERDKSKMVFAALITASLSACGGNSGQKSTAVGSGDAIVDKPVLVYSAADFSSSFREISNARPRPLDLKSFSYDISVSTSDTKSRRCDGLLRVSENNKIRFKEVAFTWAAQRTVPLTFLFKYSDFNYQKFDQLDNPVLALKLTCQIVGELE